MDYYISVIKEAARSLVSEMGWVAVGFVLAVVIAVALLIGKNVRWKR